MREGDDRRRRGRVAHRRVCVSVSVSVRGIPRPRQRGVPPRRALVHWRPRRGHRRWCGCASVLDWVCVGVDARVVVSGCVHVHVPVLPIPLSHPVPVSLFPSLPFSLPLPLGPRPRAPPPTLIAIRKTPPRRRAAPPHPILTPLPFFPFLVLPISTAARADTRTRTRPCTPRSATVRAPTAAPRAGRRARARARVAGVPVAVVVQLAVVVFRAGVVVVVGVAGVVHIPVAAVPGGAGRC